MIALLMILDLRDRYGMENLEFSRNDMLVKGLVVTDKSERVYHFHKNTLHAANELFAAAGKNSFGEVDINIFMRGDEFAHLSDAYFSDNLSNVRSY